jgi:hypothetical protein
MALAAMAGPLGGVKAVIVIVAVVEPAADARAMGTHRPTAMNPATAAIAKRGMRVKVLRDS